MARCANYLCSLLYDIEKITINKALEKKSQKYTVVINY